MCSLGGAGITAADSSPEMREPPPLLRPILEPRGLSETLAAAGAGEGGGDRVGSGGDTGEMCDEAAVLISKLVNKCRQKKLIILIVIIIIINNNDNNN